VALVFGELPAPSAVRVRTSFAALTMSEYFRDEEGQDSLLFLDNAQQFVQASSEMPAPFNEIGFQKRIGATKRGSVTLVQSYHSIPDDVIVEHFFPNLDTHLVLSRQVAEKGIYPAIDPLKSSSWMLHHSFIESQHYITATSVLSILDKYKSLKDVIEIVGMDGLSESDKITVARARKIELFLSQPLFMSQSFTGIPGSRVTLEETIEGFDKILMGEADDMPEKAFYMVGRFADAIKKAAALAPGKHGRSLRGSEVV